MVLTAPFFQLGTSTERANTITPVPQVPKGVLIHHHVIVKSMSIFQYLIIAVPNAGGGQSITLSSSAWKPCRSGRLIAASTSWAVRTRGTKATHNHAALLAHVDAR